MTANIERVFTHPGEMLHEEFMVPLNLSANALAAATHIPVARILDIVQQRSDVDADVAARFARYFGTSERFWTNLQAEYDLSVIRQNKREELAGIIPYREYESHVHAFA
ncbi:MAG: HigA family addiction module antitoxin [Thermoguttaceae bacterium]